MPAKATSDRRAATTIVHPACTESAPRRRSSRKAKTADHAGPAGNEFWMAYPARVMPVRGLRPTRTPLALSSRRWSPTYAASEPHSATTPRTTQAGLRRPSADAAPLSSVRREASTRAAIASAADFTIEANVVSDNAGSNIKAAGSNGTIRYNRLEGGRLGLVFSDNASPVVAYYNLVFGEYQHGVLLTAGTTPAKARLWNNTIVVTARSGTPGDASAVFVKAAALLDLRNNIVSYTNADNAGSAVNVPDAGQLGGFAANDNWFSSMQPRSRHFVWNGARVDLAQWTSTTGQDGASLATAPPELDVDGHVVSSNLGRARGHDLGLTRDYAGTALVPGAPPDIGAYQLAPQ